MEILLNSRKYDFLEIGSSLESVNVRFFESFVRDSFLWHQWLAPSEFYMYQCSYNKLLSAFSRSLSLSILFTFVLTEAVVQRCSVKKVFLEILLFRLRPATLLKKRLWHRCLPVNFTKFLWTPFFTKHHRWLLLHLLRITPIIWYRICNFIFAFAITASYYFSHLFLHTPVDFELWEGPKPF